MIEFTAEHREFRALVRRFVETEINPNADKWEAAGIFPAHEVFATAGELGLFGLEVDPAFGGQGADHIYNLILGEELGKAIGHLPEREQLVLSLYYEQELNLKEIGAVLGVSESRVCQIHGQAMLRLRSRLTDWRSEIDAEMA